MPTSLESEENSMSESNSFINKIIQMGNLPWMQKILPGILIFLMAFIFTFIPFWPLILIAGIIGGIIATSTRRAFWGGVLGGLLAWALYFLIKSIQNQAIVHFEQISGFLLGSSSLAWILVFIFMLMGGLIAGLGANIGFNGKQITTKMLAERKQTN